MGRLTRGVAAVTIAGALAACGAAADEPVDGPGTGRDDGASPVASSSPGTAAAYGARLDLLEASVDAWAAATTIADARRAAEAAANLVVGPGGPGFGDRDGDGTVQGDVDAGLLPGRGGTPAGVADALAGVGCVDRDVLDTVLEDPDAAWDRMEAAIAGWTTTDNTMPTLPSHPMRVVGWATFTLATDDLATAHEYAGHARLHVDVARAAPTC